MMMTNPIENQSEITKAIDTGNARGVAHQTHQAENNFTQHHYDDVLNIIGFGRIQKRLMTICALLILMNMNELMGISVISIAAHCDLQMNNARKGVVHAMGLWGKIISSFFWGHLSDRLGRRPVLICSTIMANSFSLLSMLMPNYWSFICFRFFMGLSAGGIVAITLTYLSEFLTINQRPFLINYVNISNGLSYVYTSIIAYIVGTMDWKLPIADGFLFRPWRLMILFNTLPGMLAVFLLTRFPESPRILLALGKNQEAYRVADWVCRHNHEGKSLQDFNVYQLIDTEIKRAKAPITLKFLERFHDTYELFQHPHVWNFVVCCVLLTGAFSISFGLGVWYPVIQNDMIFYGKHDNTQTMCDVIIETKNETVDSPGCDDHIADTSLLEDFGYGTMSIVSYIFLGMIISTKRRKFIITCLLVLGGICGLVLIKLRSSTLIVVFFCFFLVFADLSSSTLLGFMVDLIPTQLCAQASCLAMTVGRISASLTTYLIGVYLQTHCTTTFLIFAQILLFCALFAHLLSPKVVKQNKEEKPKKIRY